MTKEQLLALCEQIKDKFQLKDWTVKFFIDEVVKGDPDAWGYCEVVYGRKYANITLAEDLLRQDEFSIIHVVAHELVHVHLHHIWQSANDLMEPLSSDLRTSLDKMIRLEIERSTDALSYVVANLLQNKVGIDEVEVSESA